MIPDRVIYTILIVIAVASLALMLVAYTLEHSQETAQLIEGLFALAAPLLAALAAIEVFRWAMRAHRRNTKRRLPSMHPPAPVLGRIQGAAPSCSATAWVERTLTRSRRRQGTLAMKQHLKLVDAAEARSSSAPDSHNTKARGPHISKLALDAHMKEEKVSDVSREELLACGLEELTLHVPRAKALIIGNSRVNLCAKCGQSWPCKTYLRAGAIKDEE